MDTIAHGAAELDRLIERRSRKEPDPDETEALYMESVRRYHEQRRLQARYAWHLHHVGQAARLRRTLEELISHHEEQAAKLLDSEANEPEGETA
jgi:hypothetical protein